MISLNKYKRLLSNILTFGIGTFSSKLLVFLLVPLYTAVLTTAEYGVTDMIIQAGNLLMPLASVGMGSAMIRFGVDKSYDKAAVFSTGIFSTVFGFIVLLACWPLLSQIRFFSDYVILIYLFVLMSGLRNLSMHFTRSIGKVKLFAYDGVQSTFLTIVFTLLFLLVFKMGIVGYVLAIVCADFCSVIFLMFAAGLWKYLKFTALNKTVVKTILLFAVPLIPTSLFWWIVNVSDRYMVAFMIDEAANGLYAIAYKIPTIITLVSSVFIEAWQLSAVSEKDSSTRNDFFTRIFNALTALLFLAVSFLIFSCRFLNNILVDTSYEESWKYIPLLLIATAFCCLANFVNSVYMVERKSTLTLFTVVIGAVANIVLNFLLIPIMGINGAALATLASYFLVFFARAVTSRKYIQINFYPIRFAINVVLMLAQAFLMIAQPAFWWVWQLLCFATITIINVGQLLSMSREFLSKLLKKTTKQPS